MKIISKNNNFREGISLYFSKKGAEKIAKREQNQRNFNVAEAIDIVLMQELGESRGIIKIAELGGGAHPDRYHRLFAKLLEKPQGVFDWVDISPYMLELAPKYLKAAGLQKRNDIINYIESDFLVYLEKLSDDSLDAAIMKYTFNFVKDVGKFFHLLSKKLKQGGKFIATLDNQTFDGKLGVRSTNVQYFHNGKEVLAKEEIILSDGDSYGVKYFDDFDGKIGHHICDAETVKYYFSVEAIKRLARENGFDYFIGDWKEYAKNKSEKLIDVEQKILILTK